MHTRRRIQPWLLGTALVLGLTPVLAQNQNQQRAVLSGTTGSLRWTVYGPGNIGGLSENASNLRISVHPQARVLGARYQEENHLLVVSFRVNAPTRTVFEFHDQQLKAQGFRQNLPEVGNNIALANYTRGDFNLSLIIRRGEANAYRAELDLSEAASGNVALGQGGGQDPQAQQGQTPAQPGTQQNQTGQQNQQTQPGQAQPTQPGQAQPTQPGQAQPIQPGQAQPIQPGQTVGGIFNYQIDGTRYEFYGPGNVPPMQAGAQVVRIAVPPQAVDVREPWREVGGNVRLLFEAPLTLQQGYEFYDNLLSQQGFQRTSQQTANERYEAVYQRSGRTLRMTINTAGGTQERRNFEVLFGVANQTGVAGTTQPGQAQPTQPGQAQPTQPGQAQPTQPSQSQQNQNQGTPAITAPGALFGYNQGGLSYNFYGPDYNPQNLTTNQNQVSIMVPQGALDVQNPVQNADTVFIRFEHPQLLQQVFNTYDQMLTRQGFQPAGNNNIADSDTRIYRIYGRGNNRMALNIETRGGAPGRTNYEVTMDFTP